MQFSKKTLRCLGCAVQEVKNTELTQEIRLPDGLPDIGRVLMSWGQVMLRSKQWQSGEIELSGGVKVWTLYAPEDGTEPRVTESWLPFQLRWDTGNVDKEGPVRMMPLLRFSDSRSISARKMMIRAGVGVLAQGLYPMEAEWYLPEEVPDDVQILRQTYPVRLPVDAGERVFQLDEDLELASAGISDSKIICYTVTPEVTEKRVISDTVVFKGCTNLHLVLRDTGGIIQNRQFDLPFSQMADLDGTYGPEAQADVRIGVTDLEADMNESGQLRLKCSMVAQYLVDDCQILELAEDAFSPHRKVSFETSELILPLILEEKTEIMKAEQLLPGITGQIADSRFYPDYPRIRKTTEAVEMEIPGLFQTLYYGDDGMIQSSNVRWEGSMTVSADPDIDMRFLLQHSGQVQAMTGMDGLMVGSSIGLRLRSKAGRGLVMITSMELGQLQDAAADRPSVILRRCGNDSLWDIAKESGSSVCAICEANGITSQPQSDRMLLIPVS